MIYISDLSSKLKLSALDKGLGRIAGCSNSDIAIVAGL